MDFSLRKKNKERILVEIGKQSTKSCLTTTLLLEAAIQAWNESSRISNRVMQCREETKWISGPAGSYN